MKKYFEKILNRFGWVRRQDGDEALRAELRVKTQDHADLFIDRMKVQHELDEARTSLAALHSSRVDIDVSLGDPTPTETSKRKSYVGMVAGFHRSVLKAKLMLLINDARKELEGFDSTLNEHGLPKVDFKRDVYDAVLRGTINAYWKIDEWGENMIAEQINYNIPEDAKEKKNYYEGNNVEG